MEWKDNTIIVVILLLGIALGYALGVTVTFMSTLNHAEVTVDMNESNIVPIVLDWAEKSGYMNEWEAGMIEDKWEETEKREVSKEE